MILLISCSKLKSETPGPAREVYKGLLCKLGLEYAAKRGWDAYFVSGRYGIIAPDTVIEPYDSRMTAPLPFYSYPKEAGHWLGDSKYFSLAPSHFTRLLPYVYNQTYGMQKGLLMRMLREQV